MIDGTNCVLIIEQQGGKTIQSHLLGTPETNLRGLRTRMARSVRKSTPSSGFPATLLMGLASGLRMVMYLRRTLTNDGGDKQSD